MKKLILLPILFLCSGWTVQEMKADMDIKVLRYGKFEIVTSGMELKKLDTLYLGKNSKALLVEGDSKVWVGGNSVVRVDQIKTGQDALNLDSGKLRAQISSPEAKKYKFAIPSAVAGVRGTEFFMSASEAGENVCVLEGEVEAELANDSSKNFTVPAGKGVQIRTSSIGSQTANMVDNSNFTVAQWVAETSMDESVGYLPGSYPSSIKTHPYDENKSYSLSGTAFYCELVNPDFDRSTSDSNSTCTRIHLYPSAAIRTENVNYKLTPRLTYVAASPDFAFDAVPRKVDSSYSTIAVNEAYGAFNARSADWKVGFQKFSLADGHILSEGRLGNEPLTHLGVSAQQGPLSAFVSLGLEGQNPLDGYFPHSLFSVSWWTMESRALVYLLNVSSIQNRDNYARPEIRETNIGVKFDDRKDKYDYHLNAIYQHGSYQAGPTSSSVDVKDGLIDVSLGYFVRNDLRVFARYLDAAKNFKSYAPTAYTLGLYAGFLAIGNIKQARAGADYRLGEDKTFGFEYIQSADYDRNGIIGRRAIVSDTESISKEINLTFKHQWDEFISYQIGVYQMIPQSLSDQKNSAFGLQAFTIFSL